MQDRLCDPTLAVLSTAEDGLVTDRHTDTAITYTGLA